jgi:hypothetical protein
LIKPFDSYGTDLSNSINGSISGAASGFIVTPLDVIKTKQ